MKTGLLLDVKLVDGDGYQFCDWVRSKQLDYKTPVIFITANNSLESRITGYSVGGDDFISKPYNVIELRIRIEAKLRRSSSVSAKSVELGGVLIDSRSQSAQIRVANEFIKLDLTPIEFKLLNLFMLEPEKVFGRDEILNSIWGKDIYVFPRSVDTHISKLRAKLGSRAHLIKSIHGTGYKLSENYDYNNKLDNVIAI
jgi:DNA-binding response OmpR family regulator